MSAEQITDTERLVKLFVEKQKGDKFNLKDLLDFIEKEGGFQPAFANFRKINELLSSLCCISEVVVFYQQQQSDTPTSTHVITRDELYS